MGKALSPIEMRLYRLCDEALYWLWDPIGVRGAASARDEYWAYLPRVVELVNNGDPEAVVDYLSRIPEDRMGLGRYEAQAQRTVDFLFEARAWIERSADAQTET